jgi:predicted RecB family nuclease
VYLGEGFEVMKRQVVPTLSKSRFLAGLHCPLRLWHQCYNRELASEVTPVQQAIFDTGHEVGRLATQLYRGGVLIEEDHLHHEKAVRSTLAVMQNPNVPAIYEAAFLEDGVRVRADILKRLEDGRWNLMEVKSSTCLKNEYYPDVAVQYHVLCRAGLSINRAGILHLNNQYVYDGHHRDLRQLFSFSDLTDEVLAGQEEIRSKLARLKEMLVETGAPEIQPSRHCKTPHPCEFWEHCTRDMPEFWVMQLAGISEKKLNELAALGVDDIRHIPGGFVLTQLQERIRGCVVNRKEYVERELAGELMDVEYPVYFLDFETISPAIPRYAGTRPYETIPFQWSVHILHEGGVLEHHEYLCVEDKDPREEFTGRLLEVIGHKGTIFVYTAYEKGILNALAECLPQYDDRLLHAAARVRDLHALIKAHYYHPQFHGSFSLNAVLPVVVPSMSYDNLAIQEGQQASVDYLRMLDPATPGEAREKIKGDLLVYCAHDTLALVKIREELLGRVQVRRT